MRITTPHHSRLDPPQKKNERFSTKISIIKVVGERCVVSRIDMGSIGVIHGSISCLILLVADLCRGDRDHLHQLHHSSILISVKYCMCVSRSFLGIIRQAVSVLSIRFRQPLLLVMCPFIPLNESSLGTILIGQLAVCSPTSRY